LYKQGKAVSVLISLIAVCMLYMSLTYQTGITQSTASVSPENNANFMISQNQNATSKPWIGITTYNMTLPVAKALGLNQSIGVLVVDVNSGRPAEKAGLRGGNMTTMIDGRPIKLGGDLILKADNKTVTSNLDLTADKNAGDTLKLTVLRDKKIKEINVVLAARPDFLTYENSDYKVKIDYPFDWIKSEENLNPYNVVSFFSPEQISNLLSSSSVAQLYITVEYIPQNMTFDEYTNSYITNITKDTKDYRLIESTGSNLAGNQAHKVVFYDYLNNGNVKHLLVWTIKGNNVYQISFAAEPGRYSDYLPIAQKMLNSFQITG
jgi:hypothetical protein